MKNTAMAEFHLPTSMRELLIDRAKALPMDILWGFVALSAAVLISYLAKAIIL